MYNQRYYYLAEGECEEKLLKALKENPALIHPGKVDKFNVLKKELKPNKLMTFQPGSCVVFVFDTDVQETAILKKNIELVKSMCFQVEVLTVMQVLTFEDEIERSTDVVHAKDLTRSSAISDFKSAVNRMKAIEFRNALKRHKFDLSKLWIGNPPKAFVFIQQDTERIKTSE